MYKLSSTSISLLLIEIFTCSLCYRSRLVRRKCLQISYLEGSNPYLNDDIVWADGMRGWNYHFTTYNRSVLKGQIGSRMGWSPVQLSLTNSRSLITSAKSIFEAEQDPSRVSADPDFNVEDFIASLINAGVVYLYASRELRLLTETWCIIIMPERNYYAAEDKTGRLTRWTF